MSNLALHAYLFIPLYVKKTKSKKPRKMGLSFWIQRPYEKSLALFYSITLTFLGFI